MNSIPMFRNVWTTVLISVLGLVPQGALAGEGSRARGAKRSQGEKYAFLVAVGDYTSTDFRSLEYTQNDVRAFHEALLASGFARDNIVLMHDGLKYRYLPLGKNIRKEFTQLLSRIEDSDTLVVALSGHGAQLKKDKEKEGVPYFCPADARLDDRSSLIALEDLYKQLKTCRARRRLLLVDACRNNPVIKKSKSLVEVDLETLRGQEKMPLPKGIVAFFSCSGGEKSYEEKDLKHGVFFYHILKGWHGAAANKDGEVTLDGLAAYAKKETKKYVHLKLGEVQRPYLRSDLEDDWVLHKLDGLMEFKEGTEALNRKEYDLALKCFDKAIRINPTYTDAFKGRGVTYQAKRLHDRAIADFTQAIKLNPKDITAYKSRGMVYYDQGQYDRAVADCTEAIRLDPQDALAYNYRGLAFLYQSKYTQAHADFSAAIRLDGGFGNAYNNRGIVYNNRGQYDQAIAEFSKAIELNPNDALGYANRGNTYNNSWKYSKAIADCTTAIRLDGKYAPAYNTRGLAYHNTQQFELALADFNAALRVNPQYTYAYKNRGEVYWAKKKYSKAIAEYTKAIRIDPNYARAYANRGWVYADMGKFDLGIADCTTAIRLDSKDADCYHCRGHVYVMQRKYSKAIKDYTKAIKLNPKGTGYYFDRSLAYKALGKNSRANADLKTYQSLKKNR